MIMDIGSEGRSHPGNKHELARMLRWFWLSAIFLGIVDGQKAFAQQELSQQTRGEESEQTSSAPSQWEVGLGPLFMPAYPGSSKSRVVPFPYIQTPGLLNGRVFISSVNGIGVNLLNFNNHLRVGVALTYGFGRDYHYDKSSLAGVPDISSAIVVRGFMVYDFEPFNLGVDVDQRLGSSAGATVNFHGAYTLTLSPRWQINFGPQITWADHDYEETFFSVTPETASAATALGNSLHPYRAHAGIENVGLLLNTRYELTPHWEADGLFNLSTLTGDAANSPLTNRKFDPSFGVFAAYRF